MIQMNLFTKQKETPTYKMNLWLPGKGYLGSLRRSRIHAVFIALGAYCVAPGTLRSAVWQQGWEGGRGKKGHMYIYGCVPLLSTWNHHSIGNLCVCVCVLGCSVTFNFLQPHGLQSPRLLCPWNLSGMLERAAIPSSRGSSRPGEYTRTPASLALAGGLLITAPPGKPC